MVSPRTAPDELRAKFAAARRELSETLIERDSEIDLALTALIAREHLLLVGPPGCAKSMLLDSLLSRCGGQKFSLLLTKFTSPEEVFGPLSVTALKADRFVRVTTGRLPEADFAFVDEIFKASSAILNTLLKILNERRYDTGDGGSIFVPLKLCVAAGNEWPSPETGQELSAVFDRFLLRKTVRPIASRTGRQRLLWSDDRISPATTAISPAELDLAHAAASALPRTKEARAALEEILRELAKEGIRPGDRRQFKTVGAVRAFAWLDGADEVRPEHLEVAAHTLWDAPEEQPEKVATVIARIANPAGMRLNQLLLETEGILAETNVRDLAQAATATAKLVEIDRQLAGLKGNGRTERARSYVKDQIRTIRLASIDSL